MERRKFSREFKLAAVRKVLEQGLSYSEVAREFNTRDTYIHKWEDSFRQDGTLEAEIKEEISVEEELKRLREENRQLKMERDILKKATAYFVKQNADV